MRQIRFTKVGKIVQEDKNFNFGETITQITLN